jgi:hypothetical protein
MMRYAPGETDTKKKKMYCLKKGLNSRLKVALSGPEAHALHKEKKHRFESSSPGMTLQRPRAHVLPQPRSCYTQGAMTAPSHGGGTYTANYHHPAQSHPAPSRPT